MLRLALPIGAPPRNGKPTPPATERPRFTGGKGTHYALLKSAAKPTPALPTARFKGGKGSRRAKARPRNTRPPHDPPLYKQETKTTFRKELNTMGKGDLWRSILLAILAGVCWPLALVYILVLVILKK